jgi:hypothetical protein
MALYLFSFFHIVELNSKLIKNNNTLHIATTYILKTVIIEVYKTYLIHQNSDERHVAMAFNDPN